MKLGKILELAIERYLKPFINLIIVNGTYIDDKKINLNQLVILRKETQIRLGECPNPLIVRGNTAYITFKRIFYLQGR
jgi:hypothetical protein